MITSEERKHPQAPLRAQDHRRKMNLHQSKTETESYKRFECWSHVSVQNKSGFVNSKLKLTSGVQVLRQQSYRQVFLI